MVIIPNINLETPHYLVERLRSDQAESEGEIPSHILSELANQAQQQELPVESQPPTKKEAAVKPPFTSVPPAPVEAKPTESKPAAKKPGLLARLVTALFSDEPVVEDKDKDSRNKSRQSRSKREDEKRGRRRGRNSDRPREDRENRSEQSDERSRNRHQRNTESSVKTLEREQNQSTQRQAEATTDTEEKSSRRDPKREDRREDRRRGDRKRDGEKPRANGEPNRAHQNISRIDQTDEDFSAVDPAERQPSEQTLAESKRQPRRDRNVPRKSAPKQPAVVRADNPGIVVVEETPRKAPAIVEAAPRPARAGNDPRNRGKAAADDGAGDVAIPEQGNADAVLPKVDPPAANEATSRAPELTLEAPGADETTDVSEHETVAIDAKPADTGMDVDVHSEPDEDSITALDTTAAITDLDSNIEHSQTEAAGSDVAQDAVVELAAEPPRTMRPTRAANDPREVRRREREAALRAQGVTIANSSSSQDTTEGSSSS